MVSIYIGDSKYSDRHKKNIYSGVSVCHYSSLSLSDYVLARSEFCSGTHHQPCCRCSKIQEVADTILKEEFIALHKAYQLVSPNTKSDIMVKAKRKLLQLPLVPITIGQPNSGAAFTLLVEHQQFLNYVQQVVSNVAKMFTSYHRVYQLFKKAAMNYAV